MTTFVFVHGAMHGAWCWQPVLEPLRAAGHSAIAIDLPGRDGATRPVLSDYVQAVADAVAAAPPPVILVAHSVGGITASEFVGSHAGAVRGLVLANALLAWDGQSALGQIQSAGEDCVFMQPGTLAFSPDGTTVSVTDNHAVEGFYNLCHPDTARDAATRLCPEPVGPLTQPMQLSTNGFRAIPKIYLGARQDRVLPWWLQQQISNAAVADFAELSGDHSPFLSAPDELLAHLTHIQALWT
jgi:pimeloyl-ACP methyl ester carboxylesterase